MTIDSHVVVYFDVNKTVIMHDPVQGKGLDHILNDLLTEHAFGQVAQDAVGDTHWHWNGASALQNLAAAERREGEVSYGDFLRAKYPMSEDPAIAKERKQLRKEHRQDFTSAGGAGEGLAGDHRMLRAKLELPAKGTAAAVSDDALAAAGLAGARGYFLLPAFFAFVTFLHERGTSFNLVFRTFGDDLERVAQEFNCFCEGRHPLFPTHSLMDGSDGGVDRRIHLSPDESESAGPRFGTFFRSDEVTALVMGTFVQPGDDDSEQSLAFYEHLASSSSLDAKLEIYTGLRAIHEQLTRRWRAQQATLALRDFYPFWFRKCELASAGKLLTLDPSDRQLHALFFDDNILVDDAHIVDARDVRNGASLAFVNGTKGVHLMPVEPLNVILNDQFFIEQFLASIKSKQAQMESFA